LEQTTAQAVLYLASAGWHELYINGKKADDRVLAPCITQFNKHINYIEYDISMLLRQGRNAITVLLGNGGFNAQPNDVWNFNHASWRDYPRMCCDLEIDGKTFLYSDNTWKVNTGALIFDSMRSGETWDCAKDINGVFEADFDDTGWQNAFIVRPPAGTPLREEMEPCKICENALPANTRQTDPCTLVYDFG
jgi:alpha-L-rhamnosidase